MPAENFTGSNRANSPLIFVHIPKTAGSWINHLLRCNFGVRHCSRFIPCRDIAGFSEQDLRFAQTVFPGLKSISSHSILDPGRCLPSQRNCFSFLREPIARTASAYQYKVNHGLFDDERAGTLEHFAMWIAAPENQDYQIRQIAGATDLHRAQCVIRDHFFFIGLTECYETSLEALAMLSPVPLNTSVAEHQWENYSQLANRAQDNSLSRFLLTTPDTRRLLEAANRHDSEFYRWVKLDLYPQYLAKAMRAEQPQPPPVKATNRAHSKFFNNVIYATAQRLKYKMNDLPGYEQPVW